MFASLSYPLQKGCVSYNILESLLQEDMDMPRGRPPLYTEEQRREKRRVKSAAWREANRERAREIGREAMKRAAAERAIEAGRPVGKIGRPVIYTEEEKRAQRNEKTKRHYAKNADAVREKAKLRERAKRAGTFVSSALPRLTDEERRASAVVAFHKRRAKLKEVGGTYGVADIRALRVVQQDLCLFCGEKLGPETPHIDHWIPISRGGSNAPENLALLHERCNVHKRDFLPSQLGLPDTPAEARALLKIAN